MNNKILFDENGKEYNSFIDYNGRWWILPRKIKQKTNKLFQDGKLFK